MQCMLGGAWQTIEVSKSMRLECASFYMGITVYSVKWWLATWGHWDRPVHGTGFDAPMPHALPAGQARQSLAELRPAFDAAGSVTAGTSSPLTDGAAAVLVTSAEYAAANGLKVLAQVRAIAGAGCEPEIMGMGPVHATRKVLERGGLNINDIDIVELNEAFASQALACMSELGIDPAKVNLDGGAIALGHPLGATGARITGKAAQLLAREGKRYALATQCIGGGQGIATLLERAQ